MGKKPGPDGAVCRNRRASYRFQIIEKIECGVALSGAEVKSLRNRAASLEEAYAIIDNNELWLIKCHIAPYSHGPAQRHDPLRRRKLLIHARELRKLKPRVERRGQTLVPLRIYFNERGLAKVTLALAQGKTSRDKREDLKARDHKRDMDRAMRKGR